MPRGGASPFTSQQLASLKRQRFGNHDGLVRRLLATIRELESRLNEKHVADNGRVDELAGENRQLQEQLERLKQEAERYRVLILGDKNESIEVYADPRVKIAVAHPPVLNNLAEYEKGLEWALARVPDEFRGMVNDALLKPQIYSVHCMDKLSWAYYREHVEAHRIHKLLKDTVEEIVTQNQEHEASEAGEGAPPGAEDVPF